MSEENGEARLNADLATKRKLLKFTMVKIPALIEDANVLAMERELKAMNAIVSGVDDLRKQLEQLKFEKGDEPEAVTKWGEELDTEVKRADGVTTTLTNAISEVRSNQIVKEKEREHALKGRNVKNSCNLRTAVRNEA